jgi:hypothetical protein
MFAALSFALIVGCSTTQSENASGTTGSASAGNGSFEELKSHFITDSEGRLNGINAEVNRMRETISRDQGEERVNSENLVRDLDLKIDEARDELVDVKAATASNEFEIEKKDVERRLSDLELAYKQAKPQIH